MNRVAHWLITEKTDFFSHANTRAAEWASQHGAVLVTQIENSTRSRVHDVIAYGLNEGLMREDIIDMIMDQSFGEARATLIADHEIAIATGQGAEAGYREAKAARVKIKKIWVTDDDPCEDCDANSDIEIDIEDLFPSGDEDAPAHVNCRCHTESVVEDDEDVDD
jgi:Phage Mu protein F like protein